MSRNNLYAVFSEWRQLQQPLVLASVYETQGSTYSKAGAQMLINSAGDFQGMLSGGCLEGDLAERARQVVASGESQAVTYDLTQDDEDLWGLGVGCDGLMRIFLQQLKPAQDFQPLGAMLDACLGDSTQIAATIITSDVDGLPSGSSLIVHGDQLTWSDIESSLRAPIIAAATAARANDQSEVATVALPEGECRVLCSLLRPYPNILVLGAGLDAEPVVRLCAELGWRVTVSDHRPGYLDKGDFSAANDVRLTIAEDLARSVKLDTYDAAIVMSHHLVTDETYLRQLAESNIAYVGLLGPVNRRKRLLDKLGDVAGALEDRLHGPAGIDINASGPAAIALSIVAEVQQCIVRAVR